jgi:hypothetical protein
MPMVPVGTRKSHQQIHHRQQVCPFLFPNHFTVQQVETHGRVFRDPAAVKLRRSNTTTDIANKLKAVAILGLALL